MRLLVVSNIVPNTVLGGYEHATADLVRRAQNRGWEVEVLTSTWPATTTDEPIAARRILRWNFSAEHPHPSSFEENSPVVSGNAAAVQDTLDEFRPDRILLMNLYGLGLVSILAPILNSGIPMTAYLMDNWPQARPSEALVGFDWMLSSLLEYSGIQWVACSSTLAREVEMLSGSAVVSTEIVPAWTNVLPVVSSPRQNPKNFAFVSSLSKQKGAEATLSAFVTMFKSDPDLRLTFFGDGPIRKELEEQGRTLPDGTVEFTGWVSREDVCSRLPDFGALVFPTWSREPFGFVILEAMAAGVPVISTLHGGTESMPEGTYLLCEQQPSSIARAMQSLIDDPLMGHAIAERAWAHVDEHHRRDVVTDRLLDLVAENSTTGVARSTTGLRQNATLEVLGTWLNERAAQSPRSVRMTRLVAMYGRLPYSAQRRLTPLKNLVYRKLLSRRGM